MDTKEKRDLVNVLSQCRGALLSKLTIDTKLVKDIDTQIDLLSENESCAENLNEYIFYVRAATNTFCGFETCDKSDINAVKAKLL